MHANGYNIGNVFMLIWLVAVRIFGWQAADSHWQDDGCGYCGWDFIAGCQGVCQAAPQPPMPEFYQPLLHLSFDEPFLPGNGLARFKPISANGRRAFPGCLAARYNATVHSFFRPWPKIDAPISPRRKEHPFLDQTAMVMPAWGLERMSVCWN